MIHKRFLLRGTPRSSGGSGGVNHVGKKRLAKQSLAGVILGLIVPGHGDNLGSAGCLFKHGPAVALLVFFPRFLLARRGGIACSAWRARGFPQQPGNGGEDPSPLCQARIYGSLALFTAAGLKGPPGSGRGGVSRDLHKERLNSSHSSLPRPPWAC